MNTLGLVAVPSFGPGRGRGVPRPRGPAVDGLHPAPGGALRGVDVALTGVGGVLEQERLVVVRVVEVRVHVTVAVEVRGRVRATQLAHEERMVLWVERDHDAIAV